jgi:3-phosphoshikimate 1-carboxyvinyltransferase
VPVAKANLYVANSGTTVRFLTAMLAIGHGTYRLDGTPRMRQRPIGDLLYALRQLGAEVVSETATDCPPVVMHACGLSGGQATVAGDISSQFLSGLLMAAPYAAGDVELIVEGELVSRPYIDITLAVMAAFGVSVDVRKPTNGMSENKSKIFDQPLINKVGINSCFHISAPRPYSAREYMIEPDASAASYFFAAAAVTQGTVTVEGLSQASLQGDVAFCECLKQMGCDVQYGPNSITVVGRPLHGIDVDMNARTPSATRCKRSGPWRSSLKARRPFAASLIFDTRKPTAFTQWPRNCASSGPTS